MLLLISSTSLPFAFLITPFERVVRSDGTKIVMAETLSTKLEVKRIAKTVTSRLIVLSSLWALWSFFYRYIRDTHMSRRQVLTRKQRLLEHLLGNLFLSPSPRALFPSFAFVLHVSLPHPFCCPVLV